MKFDRSLVVSWSQQFHLQLSLWNSSRKLTLLFSLLLVSCFLKDWVFSSLGKQFNDTDTPQIQFPYSHYLSEKPWTYRSLDLLQAAPGPSLTTDCVFLVKHLKLPWLRLSCIDWHLWKWNNKILYQKKKKGKKNNSVWFLLSHLPHSRLDLWAKHQPWRDPRTHVSALWAECLLSFT